MAPDGSFNDTLSDDESRPSIASNRLGPLTHHKKPEAGAPFVRLPQSPSSPGQHLLTTALLQNLVFVGAGNINFVSPALERNEREEENFCPRTSRGASLFLACGRISDFLSILTLCSHLTG